MANKKRLYIVVDKEEIMTILEVIDKIKHKPHLSKPRMEMEIGNCGWKKEPSKWFIHFNVSNDQWCEFVRTLEKQNYGLIIKETKDLYLIKK